MRNPSAQMFCKSNICERWQVFNYTGAQHNKLYARCAIQGRYFKTCCLISKSGGVLIAEKRVQFLSVGRRVVILADLAFAPGRCDLDIVVNPTTLFHLCTD